MEEQGSLAQKRRRTWAPVTSTSARCTLQLRASEWTYENILRCSIISTRKETYLKQNGNCQQPQGSRICDLQKSSTAILLFLLTCLDGFNDSRHGAIARVWQVAALNHILYLWQMTKLAFLNQADSSSLLKRYATCSMGTCRLLSFMQLPTFSARKIFDSVRGCCSKVELDCYKTFRKTAITFVFFTFAQLRQAIARQTSCLVFRYCSKVEMEYFACGGTRFTSTKET